MSKNDITQFEIPCLPKPNNHTDGHVHRPLSASEDPIIDELPAIYRNYSREDVPQLIQAYVSASLALAGQSETSWLEHALLQPSASNSVEIVANLLRLRFKNGVTGENAPSVALIEPCFDNLANILKRHDLPLEPVPESWLTDDREFHNFSTLKSAAIFLILPNNPTGATLTEDKFRKLAEFCKETGKLLIIDNCFCFYTPPELMFDQHDILSELGVSSLLIYDTGKTWPTHDMKISMLFPSQDLYSEAYNIYTDFILHVSHVPLKLLTEFVELSAREQLVSVKEPARTNMALLQKTLEPFGFEFKNQDYISVAWIDTSAVMTGRQFVDLAEKSNIHFLSGELFFWNNPEQGENRVRIALARDVPAFAAMCQTLSAALLANGFQPRPANGNNPQPDNSAMPA